MIVIWIVAFGCCLFVISSRSSSGISLGIVVTDYQLVLLYSLLFGNITYLVCHMVVIWSGSHGLSFDVII
jgi:hypothetical protein